ncbi:MAG: ACP S-malonyltransferase [Clostridiales bacterium]
MNLAFVFAGQGSQHPEMGTDLYEKYPIFKKTFDAVDVDSNLKRLCFEAEEKELSLTQNTQPAMVAFAVSLTATLKEFGIVPKIAAGLSLGEYSALSCAGVFSPQKAVELAAFRGKVMADAVKDIHCAMVAVLGAEKETLEKICAENSKFGVVEIANFNCPGQMVIGGEKEAVEKATQMLMAEGAKKCVPLAVSGAFHTSLMKTAGDKLAEKFKTIDFAPMDLPVVFNTTALPLGNGETIAQLLENQVQTPVHFDDSISYMEAMGIDTIIEIGPGKTLKSFIRKISKNITTYSVEDCPTLEKLLNAVKGDN